MDIQELIDGMNDGGYLVYCPGTKKNITIQEYITSFLDHTGERDDREHYETVI